ncbi:alcohol acetyltransferase [Eggerthellaceae bacterium zg-887]|uniref:phthiocerol/phthiodiolone dimycocerosyl transferase family protein n=1 Tax=Xiamenia xianingshaonis TaxID=2682776 RepID=UPI00140A39BD|nr:alcohol acetyltransferase [Xiamenia xianingshaonis]NHM17032.1 alcohol acetyltransferase [Xiamenia xianingshaonis]
MDPSAWYRLDNVGKFYSSQAGSPGQTVFRFAAGMTEDVDGACLQQALDRALERFPSFNVRLRSGLFWRYLEQTGDVPRVRPEDVPICFGLHAGPDSELFRVSFYRRRINVEVSHIVSDGRGTLEFFKAIIGHYVEARYGERDAVDPYEGTEATKTENSFAANYEPEKSASEKMPKPHRLQGLRDEAAPTYFEYHVSAAEVYAAAKARGVSVTSLVVAAVIVALRRSMAPRTRNRTICMDVPVDLRRFYDSHTLRNFFGLAFVSYGGDEPVDSLGDVAQSVQSQLTAATDPEALKRRMNRMVKLERNVFSRVMPLFVKDVALGIGAWASARDVTTTVSSLGRITLPDGAAKHVAQISVLTSSRGLNFVFATYGDDLCVGVSSVFVRQVVLREFCRIFSDLGIHGYVNTNKGDREVTEALRVARIEERAIDRTAGRSRGPESGRGGLAVVGVAEDASATAAGAAKASGVAMAGAGAVPGDLVAGAAAAGAAAVAGVAENASAATVVGSEGSSATAAGAARAPGAPASIADQIAHDSKGGPL